MNDPKDYMSLKEIVALVCAVVECDEETAIREVCRALWFGELPAAFIDPQGRVHELPVDYFQPQTGRPQ